MDKQREEFEKLHRSEIPIYPLSKQPSGEYVYYATQMRWEGYQAAQAPLLARIAELDKKLAAQQLQIQALRKAIQGMLGINYDAARNTLARIGNEALAQQLDTSALDSYVKNLQINAEFYCESGDISGVTACPVINRTINDDDSLTVRLNYWPIDADRYRDEIDKKAFVKLMVDKFLCWKLPEHFHPDAGISFKPTKPYTGDEYGNSWWPVGTNLFSADQAYQMFDDCFPDTVNEAATEPKE